MREKIKIVYYIFGVPALVYHELSHFIMVFLVRGKYLGFKINSNSSALDSFNFSGIVFHSSSNNFQRFMVALAPTLFWSIGFAIVCLLKYQIAQVYFLLFISLFQCSSGDWEKVKSFGNPDVGESYTDEQINEKINK